MSDLLEKSKKEMEEAFGVPLRHVGTPWPGLAFVGHPTPEQIKVFAKLDSRTANEIVFFLNHITSCEGDCPRLFEELKQK